ncbi:MAG: efflux RND transporter periplasmic adaptor subunit [Pirellulaceae bacterium]|nr:efflux RND transporter periplasmic adaptor subunit [Pirellulaceae bacterium]
MGSIGFFAAHFVVLTIAQPGPQASLVVVRPAELRQDVTESREFVGTVVPLQRTVIGSAVDGRVEEFLVNDGDWVPQGQPLAELLKTTIGLEVAAAKAEMELRSHELTELENGSRPEEIAQADAARGRARALATYADARLERTKTLYERGASTSQEELEEAISLATAARQTLAEAESTYQLVLEGPRPEKILQAKSQLELARANHERLQDMYKKYTVRAPFDGYVTSELTEVGEWLNRGNPVVEMIAISSVEITVGVPEEFIDVQRPGRAAEIRLDALPGRVFPAKISRVIPQADVKSRTFPVKILLQNQEQSREPGHDATASTQLGTPSTADRGGESDLAAAAPRSPAVAAPPIGYSVKAGMLARVTLAVSAPKSALMVPKDALVLEEGRATLVFVVRKDPASGAAVAVPVVVQLGIKQDADVEVIGDLRDGEPVVVVGNERLSRRPPFSLVDVQRVAEK